MAMLFMEGFDAVDATETYSMVSRRFDTKYYRNINGAAISTTTSNFSGPCLSFGSTLWVAAAEMHGTSDSSNEVFLGFWIYFSSAPGAATYFFTLSEGADDVTSTATNSRNFQLFLDASGRICVRQWYDTNSTLDYTGSASVTDSTWHWFEARLHWNNTTGDVETYIDGSADITVNLADTIGAASPPTFTGYTHMSIRGPTSGTCKIDDVLVYDVNGTPTGTPTSGDFPLGESKIETLRPSGSGTNTDWSLGAGYYTGDASNYEAVTLSNNDFSNTVDHSIIYSGTNGDIDTYAFGNLSNSPTEIHTICINALARRCGTGTIYLQGAAYSSATNGATSSAVVKRPHLKYIQTEMPYDPNTTALWTGSGVDAAEFGVKLSTS